MNDSGNDITVDVLCYLLVLLVLGVKALESASRSLFVCIKVIMCVKVIVYMCVKVIESWKVRMRKPERHIYELTLRALNVQPNEAVFLVFSGSRSLCMSRSLCVFVSRS